MNHPRPTRKSHPIEKSIASLLEGLYQDEGHTLEKLDRDKRENNEWAHEYLQAQYALGIAGFLGATYDAAMGGERTREPLDHLAHVLSVLGKGRDRSTHAGLIADESLGLDEVDRMLLKSYFKDVGIQLNTYKPEALATRRAHRMTTALTSVMAAAGLIGAYEANNDPHLLDKKATITWVDGDHTQKATISFGDELYLGGLGGTLLTGLINFLTSCKLRKKADSDSEKASEQLDMLGTAAQHFHIDLAEFIENVSADLAANSSKAAALIDSSPAKNRAR